MSADSDIEVLLPPPNGWRPEDFPQITVVQIPYTSSPSYRADPHVSIRADGWIYIEVGNVRIAVPDEEEWAKLTNMVSRMLNSWQAARLPQTEEPDNAIGEVDRVQQWVATPPDDQSGSCGLDASAQDHHPH